MYLFDALQKNESVLKATGIYPDTHERSAAVYGMAFLPGVELLPAGSPNTVPARR